MGYINRIKNRWDIAKNWQLLFPFLGAILTLATSYYISRKLLHAFSLNNTWLEWPFTLLITGIGYWLMLKSFLWCFQKLKHKWITEYRWEMIAIFIVFAITGSVSGRLAGPVAHYFGIHVETTGPWIYWPIRILLIFPLYQVLLVAFGWLFGQFRFFWDFEKKMLKRMGLGFFVR